MKLEVIIPNFHVVSISNLSAHYKLQYFKKMGVFNKQKRVIKDCLIDKPKPTLPVIITLIRVCPGKLGSDNLVSAFKAIIDAIADWLIPGLAPGRADGDKRLMWGLKQIKDGRKKELRITFEEREPEQFFAFKEEQLLFLCE